MRAAPITLFFAWILTGCSTAHFTPADPQDAGCQPIIEYPCKPLPAGSAAHSDACDSNPSASGRLEKQIPVDASYPYACTIIVPDVTPDEAGNCIFDGTCRCVEQSDGGLGWTCTVK